MIGRGKPALWLHGHVHNSNDYMVGGTRVVSNPKGHGPWKHGGRIENGAFGMKVVEV